MLFKQHLVVASTGAFIYSSVTFEEVSDTALLPFLFLKAIAVLAGGLFPDIDTGSKSSRIFAYSCLLGSLYFAAKQLYPEAILVALSYVFCKIGKHRGWTHKYWLPVSLILLSATSFQYAPLLQAFAVGIMIHYIVDGILPWQKKAW